MLERGRGGILLHHRQRRDRTMVLATPVPELVAELADHVGVIGDGKLLAYNTVDDFKKLAGENGTLEDAYQQLVNPHTMEKVARYLEGGGA